MPTDDDGNDAYRGRSGSGNLQAPFAYLLHLPVHIPVHTCIRLTYLLLTCFTCLLTVSTCMAVSIYIRPVAAAAALLLLLLLLPAPTTTLPIIPCCCCSPDCSMRPLPRYSHRHSYQAAPSYPRHSVHVHDLPTACLLLNRTIRRLMPVQPRPEEVESGTSTRRLTTMPDLILVLLDHVGELTLLPRDFDDVAGSLLIGVPAHLPYRRHAQTAVGRGTCLATPARSLPTTRAPRVGLVVSGV